VCLHCLQNKSASRLQEFDHGLFDIYYHFVYGRNIVSTVNLDCKLDLKAIALQARNAEYNPKRFAAVIMRIREPKTTALIFASGKMVWHQCHKLSIFKDGHAFGGTIFPYIRFARQNSCST